MPRVTITVPEKNAQPYRFQLDRGVVTLGRGSENDIPINCGSISVKHAEMCRIPGGYELRDLGSTNGIKLDGERCEVIPLRSGMSAKLGDVSFDFSLTDEELEILAREKPADDSPVVREPELPPLDLPPAKSAPPHSHVPEDSERMGSFMILLFFVLAVAAFVAGMAVRFQRETGGSMLDAILTRGENTTAPAKADAPATQETVPAE